MKTTADQRDSICHFQKPEEKKNEKREKKSTYPLSSESQRVEYVLLKRFLFVFLIFSPIRGSIIHGGHKKIEQLII